ncbi:TonB-dependent receptor [Halioxenophilus aromaticivorans]|uniref:TonB-dependent receptor n=1 Tax=Halioxenophilus aromaticivorans TaxID=1306992 RepID=A0AAV3U377_9ALTE
MNKNNLALAMAAMVPAVFVNTAIAQESSQLMLEEVVVTATRRAESLQDVPLAVSAISGETITKNGFQNLEDIQFQFSGVQFGESPNDAGFRLRGVGTAGGFSSSSESNVATVVDNVVIPFGNPVSSLGDLQRVEVLKGPQGTQFGKNASSGVVNITTAKPSFDEFGGKVFVSYADLNETNVNANFNIPLSETLAAGVYLYHQEHDGFYENVTLNKDWGGQDSKGARAKLLWEPSDDLSVYVIGDYSKRNVEGPLQTWTVNRLPSFSNPIMAARFGNFETLGITVGDDNNKSAEEFDSYSSEENYGASVEVNWALGDYDLTSISAYRVLDQGDHIFAIDGSSTEIFTSTNYGLDQAYFSEELRLSYSGDKWQYTTGLYYSRRDTGDADDVSTTQLRPAAPFNPFIVSISRGLSTTQTDSSSAAVFFDGTLALSDNLRMISGLRFQYDEVEAKSYSNVDPNWAPSPPGPPVAGQVLYYEARPMETGSTDDTGWSGRFGFEYTASDDVMYYATVARGYLGPTVTFSGLTGTRSEVGAQTVVDFTAGFKSQLLDNRLTFNGNIFFDKYEDMQTSAFNGLEFLTESAGGFEAKGFEFDATWLAAKNLIINASYTYSDTEFTDYVTSCPDYILLQGDAAVAAQCSAPGSTADTALYQAAGDPLNGAPKHSAVLGFTYNQDLSDDLVFDFSTNVYYRSKAYYDVGDEYATQDAYSTVGLNIGLSDMEETWRLALFARNLFDEQFQSAVITLPFSDAGGYVNWTTREAQRTVGASFQYSF